MGELSPRQYAEKIKGMCENIIAERDELSRISNECVGMMKESKDNFEKTKEHLKNCKDRYAEALRDKEFLDKGENNKRLLKQSLREEWEQELAGEFENIKKPNLVVRFFAAFGIAFIVILVFALVFPNTFDLVFPSDGFPWASIIWGPIVVGAVYIYKLNRDYKVKEDAVREKIKYETELSFNNIMNRMRENVANIQVYQQQIEEAQKEADEACKATAQVAEKAKSINDEIKARREKNEQSAYNLMAVMDECGFPEFYKPKPEATLAVCDYIINGIAENFKEAAREYKHDLDNKRMQEHFAAQQKEMEEKQRLSEERHNREMAAMQQSMSEGMKQLGDELRKAQEENARMQARYAEAQAKWAEDQARQNKKNADAQERHNREMEYLQKERLREERKQREELERLNYKMNE